ncbi:MAG: RnfABCDGE type electron transport complex subunit G [bacterium]
MRDILRLIVVLTLVCVVAAIALAKVYDFTKEPIAEQRRLARLKAVEAVLPEHDNQPDENTVTVNLASGESRMVYLGFSGDGISGVAFEISNSEGYGGEIVAMLGLDPNGVIQGVEIVRHSETPGLGAKVTLPEFRSQFVGKSLVNATFAVKKDGGDFDQVTGATTSPRAIVKAIRQGLELFQAHRDEIIQGTSSERMEGQA